MLGPAQYLVLISEHYGRQTEFAMAKGQRNVSCYLTSHFWPVITPLEKISICNAHPTNPTLDSSGVSVAMGDRAHFSRPYMGSGDDDEGGKRENDDEEENFAKRSRAQM